MATDNDEIDGLLCISLDSDDDGNAEECAAQEPRKQRGAQDEEEFQAVRGGYFVKVENGDIWKTTTHLPAHPTPISKPDAQNLLHAVEELYYFRRYAEASSFVNGVLGHHGSTLKSASTSTAQNGGNGEGGSGEGWLDRDTQVLLERYRDKIASRLKE